MKKIVNISIFIILVISLCPKVVFASQKIIEEPKFIESKILLADEKTKIKEERSERGIGDAITGANDFLSASEELNDGEKKRYSEMMKDEDIENFSNTLVNMFIVAGTVLAVIYISILGIKYMTGAVEEKAEIKETLIPFIIGCAVVFGAFSIWKMAITIGSNL